MIIYKVHFFINQRKRNKDIIRVDQNTQIIINNIVTAKACFKRFKHEVEQFSYLKGYFGRAELFIPHIFEDGTLAYWPDNGNYIEQYIVEEK